MTARSLLALAAALLLGRAAAQVQSARPDHAIRVFPRGDLFEPLVADPKQPRFSTAAVLAYGPSIDGAVGLVGVGQTIGIVRWSATASEGIQVGLGGGISAQFDMDASQTDLINADYLLELPFAYRRGPLASRLRLFHQSSHLGDEYLVHARATRENVVINGVELLLAHDFGAWRGYGGGEYRYGRTPAELRATLLHWGVEYRGSRELVRWRGGGGARLIAALDGKTSQSAVQDVAWSFRAGFDFTTEVESGGRGWSVLAHAYRGLGPYGQFYAQPLSVVGLEIRFNL